MTCILGGCREDSGSARKSDAASQGTAGSTAIAGTFGNAVAGSMGSSDAAVAVSAGGASSVGGSVAIDAAVMLETCPPAASRPQDGEWTSEGQIIETACPADFPLGAAEARFAKFTIKTAALEHTNIDRDITLTAPNGEHFRGFVRDDVASISGPIEYYPDKPLDVMLWMVFSGYCFTAHAEQVVQASTGPCTIRTYLLGRLVGAP